MFLGELMCLGMYGAKLLYGKYSKKKEIVPASPGTEAANQMQLKTNINPALLAIPATCDIIGSTLTFIALTLCAASVYQMMRGTIVIICAGMSMIFLKKRQYRHHWLSLLTIFIGVFMVGLSSLLYENNESGSGTKPLGIILVLVGQLFAGT